MYKEYIDTNITSDGGVQKTIVSSSEMGLSGYIAAGTYSYVPGMYVHTNMTYYAECCKEWNVSSVWYYLFIELQYMKELDICE